MTENTAYSGGAMSVLSYSPIIQYSNAWANSPNNYIGVTDPTGTDGNISEDPMFLDRADPDPSNWDLHLGASSLTVDAGDPSISDPDGTRSDIGAYGGPDAEFWDLDRDGFPSWWQPGPYDFVTYPDLGWDCNDRDAAVYPGNGC